MAGATASGARGGDRLRIATLAAFSSPVLLFQAIEIPWRTYLPAVLTGSFGVSFALAGTLLAAVRLFDGVLDLFVGWASDTRNTRYGRRRPWLAAGVAPVMLGAWLLFFAAPGGSLPPLIAGCLLLHTGYTMIVTPHGGWGLEIGRTPAERLRVIAAKTWAGALAVPLIASLVLVPERAFDADRLAQAQTFGAGIMVLAPACVLLVLRTVPERGGPARATAAAPPLPSLLALLWADRRVRTLASLYALVGLSEAVSAGSFVFFVENAMAIEGWTGTLLFAQSAAAVITLPLWTIVTGRIGKERTLLIAFAWQIAAGLVALTLPRGALVPLLLFLIARQACWGVDFLLLRAVAADISGQLLADGVSLGSMLYAGLNVTLRIAMSLGAGSVLWILAAFDPGRARFADAARLVYGLGPLACGGLAMGVTLAFLYRRSQPCRWQHARA